MQLTGTAEIAIDAVDLEQAKLRDMGDKTESMLVMDAALAKEGTMKLNRLLLKYKHRLVFHHAAFQGKGNWVVLFTIQRQPTENEKIAEECGL